jgi:hypothetical protein
MTSHNLKFLFICLHLLPFGHLLAQKHDYNWLIGYGKSGNSDTLWNSSLIDFGSNPARARNVRHPLRMDGTSINAGISDPDGKLLFYTNGCFIVNGMGNTIEGGEYLTDMSNSGIEEDCPSNFGSPIANTVVAVPIEPDSGLYAFIHKEVGQGSGPIYSFCRNAQVTYLDMKANQGAGKVYKRVNILTDTLTESDVTACKHANGKDWWFITLGVRDNRYRKFLVKKDTVLGPYFQVIGDSITKGYDICQAQFSPDGKQYARVNWCDGVMLYDFDRETGMLSNYRRFTYGCATNTDSVKLCGIAFSPNSRYLYVSGWLKMYQLDTWQSDLLATAQFLGEYDGRRDSVGPTYRWQQFFIMANGPDCKIYITPPSQGRVLHMIHHPDEPAPYCDFQQHALFLPTYRAWNLPVFAHYRLGSGPVCDSSLSIVNAIWIPPVNQPIPHQLFPNPITDGHAQLDIDLGAHKNAIFQIFDLHGKEVYFLPLKNTTLSHNLVLDNLQNGVYFYQIRTEKGIRVSGKLVLVD